jgi:hypothetical protein
MIAALPYTNIVPEELLTPGSFPSIAVTVIFVASGLISIILGYSQRPKPIISIPEAPKPALPPSEPVPSTLSQEETAKPERKKPKARRRRTRRKRKKET